MEPLKQRLITISIILVILIITGFEIFGLVTTNKLADDLKKESTAKDKQLAQLQHQCTADQAAYKSNINQAVQAARQAQEQIRETDIIYGYIIGYLTTQYPKLITDQAAELPEFAALTVQYADEMKVSPYDCLAICQIENGFDLHKPGTHHEQGPVQVMIGRWNDYYKRFGYKQDDFYKWQANYRVGIAHFAELLKQHNGDITGAIGEYNGGYKWTDIASSRYHVRKFIIANRGILRLKSRKIIQ